MCLENCPEISLVLSSSEGFHSAISYQSGNSMKQIFIGVENFIQNLLTQNNFMLINLILIMFLAELAYSRARFNQEILGSSENDSEKSAEFKTLSRKDENALLIGKSKLDRNKKLNMIWFIYCFLTFS